MIKNKWIVLIVILFFSSIIRSQDDTEENVTAEELNEKQLLEEIKFLSFEDNFLTAVQQRSVENYDRAIEHLSLCEKIYPENVAMLHEFSKNYFSKKDFLQALLYAERALSVDPYNFWIKSLKKDILIKTNNLPDALIIQKELYQTDKSEAKNLLNLYYSMQDRENGKKIIEDAEKNAIFIENITFYKKFFFQNTDSDSSSDETESNPLNAERIIVKNDIESIINHLKLLESQNKYQDLLSESTKNIELQPTQPLLYLYKGKALNHTKKNKEAIEILQNGLDFVFDNNEMMELFYLELIFAYQAEGNNSKVSYYKQLVQKLK